MRACRSAHRGLHLPCDVPHEARELAPEATISKTDPLLDCLRNEPRFQAIERELRFPNCIPSKALAMVEATSERI
jgi:hypothetical protein